MGKRREYDILWKGVVEEVFGELLEFVFPNDIEKFDLAAGFEYLDKELGELFPEPAKRSQTRYVDKLIKAWRKDGAEEYLLIHVEVQGKYEEDFAKRMFEYYCRLYTRFRRPVESLAIFTHKEGVKMPRYCEQVAVITRMRLDFHTLYLGKLEDGALAASKNPFAWVLLAAKEAMIRGKNREKKLLDHKLLVFRILYENGLMEKPKIRAIFSFLNNYEPFEEEETFRNFTASVDAITGKSNTMGIIEMVAEIREEKGLERGLEEGREQANSAVVKRMLSRPDMTPESIAELTGLPLSFIYKVRATVK